MTHDQRLIGKAVLSGILSYGLVALLDRSFGDHGLGRVLPGILFGVLVLAPAASGKMRMGTAVAFSALIYYGAVSLAAHATVHWHWRELVACGLAGFLGAVAVGVASRFILPRDVSPRRLTQAAVLGAVTGLLFAVRGTFNIPSDLEPWTMTLGFVCWQTGVAWALFRSSRP